MRSTDQRIFICGKNTGGQLGLGHLDKTLKVNEPKFAFPIHRMAGGGCKYYLQYIFETNI